MNPLHQTKYKLYKLYNRWGYRVTPGIFELDRATGRKMEKVGVRASPLRTMITMNSGSDERPRKKAKTVAVPVPIARISGLPCSAPYSHSGSIHIFITFSSHIVHIHHTDSSHCHLRIFRQLTQAVGIVTILGQYYCSVFQSHWLSKKPRVRGYKTDVLYSTVLLLYTNYTH